MTARQGQLKGVVPPLNIAQEKALLYVEAKEESKRIKDREKDRQDDMVKAAAKLRVDVIKIRDSSNKLHIFDLTNKVVIKHSQMTDIKIEKQEKEVLKK